MTPGEFGEVGMGPESMLGERSVPAAGCSQRVVYVDANPFGNRYLTGVGRYCARLALALAERATVRFFSFRDELIVPGNLDCSPRQDLARWAKQVWNSPRRPLVDIPPAAIGLFGWVREPERLFPFEVSILYDFTPIVVGETHLAAMREVFGTFCTNGLLSADWAVAISHSTKADARWLCALDPERIIAVHPGPSLEVAQPRRPCARRHDVCLVVSTIEPRKNAPFLLEWFLDSPALPAEMELRWVGPTGWHTSLRQLKRKFRLRGSGRRVRFLGVLPDARLSREYLTAGCTIYPSLYEGFGFPVLDSLRHGAPVLTSFNSSLREFDLPGVYFIDPRDFESVDAAWRLLQRDRVLPPPREELDRRFSWDRVAQAVLTGAAGHRAETGAPAATPQAA